MVLVLDKKSERVSVVPQMCSERYEAALAAICYKGAPLFNACQRSARRLNQKTGSKAVFSFFAAKTRERPMTGEKRRGNFLFALEGGNETGKLRKKEESR